jgi:hypothetical protein
VGIGPSLGMRNIYQNGCVGMKLEIYLKIMKCWIIRPKVFSPVVEWKNPKGEIRMQFFR